MRISRWFIFIIILCPAVSIYADDFKWKVGVAELSTKNIPPEYRYLSDSIPLEVLNGLESVKAHMFSEKEKELLGFEKKEEKILSLKKELSKLLETRDQFFFSTGDVAKEINEIKIKIDKKTEELNSCEESTPSPVEDDSADIMLVMDKTKTGIIHGDHISPDTVVSLKGYDQLVFGELEKIDRWLYLSVFVYNYITGEKVDIFGKLIEPNEINSIVKGAVTESVRIVSGSNPPVLIVNGTPEDAFFNIDNGINHVTGYPSADFFPGSYTLKIHRKGYYSEERTVELFEGRSTKVEFALKKIKTGFTAVNTVPAGADVYLDSEWIGKSPVIIKDPVFPSYLSISKEGFADKNSMIDDRSRNYSFVLDPVRVKLEDIMEKRRKKFYNSLGAFIISITVPVISYGISSEYGYAYNNSVLLSGISSSETDRLMSISNSWYNLYLGGVFLSASLFINMAVNLNSYISLY